MYAVTYLLNKYKIISDEVKSETNMCAVIVYGLQPKYIVIIMVKRGIKNWSTKYAF
jgi:hypothetical protein